MTGYKDLREWIEKAKEIGELKVLEGADAEHEIGVIVQLNRRNMGPAILFDKIKGFKPGFRILTNSMSNIKTINLTFGLPIENTIEETIDALRIKSGEWAEKAKDFSPVVVDSSPIMANVESGDSVDLCKFPVPLWHELDGGRFIGTGSGVITRDPDTGHLNMGTYRSQLYDSTSAGLYISSGKHGRIHRDKYFELGQPCPVTMMYGFDPLLFALGSNEIAPDIFELNYLGAIRGESVPVVIGKETGLPIPASAEIAIEGFTHKDDNRPEGPFGEWPGTYGSSSTPQPYVKVASLYYRDDPILLGSPPSKGSYSDQSLFRAVWRSALLYNEIVQTGIPNIKAVWCPPFGGTRQLIIVAVKQSYPGHATEVGHIASQTRAGAYAGKYVIVVDEDINPYDIDDVMWAVCTRSDPKQIDIINRAWSSPVDPLIRKPTENYHNSRGIIYAVKPYEWFQDFPQTAVANEKVRKAVFSKWSDAFGERWTIY